MNSEHGVIPLLSICIPSYNRPIQLSKLLNSIDPLVFDEIEIVICEDKSPRRDQIVDVVNKFKCNNIVECKLFLNEVNLGYDGNIKELINKSSGKYVMYMGDDDIFQVSSLKKYITFLKNNEELGYILRRYTVIHNNGNMEDFKYFDTDRFFEPGVNAFKLLFRKSVFISGFCFKREYVLPYYNTNQFNGTLLYQLFLCSNLVMEYPSAYCNIPITIMDDNSRGVPEFGSSVNESSNYTPGHISIQNSINFMKSYLVITNYVDTRYNFNATKIVLDDLSRYSFPILSIQRSAGIVKFLKYNQELIKSIKINSTFYYYIYFFALLFFGTNICNKIISLIKKTLGKTPNL